MAAFIAFMKSTLGDVIDVRASDRLTESAVVWWRRSADRTRSAAAECCRSSGNRLKPILEINPRNERIHWRRRTKATRIPSGRGTC